jgi:hypothetical protein
MRSQFYIAPAALALSLTGACGNQDSINEVQYGLTSAAAVGRAASLALEAVKGTASACVTVKNACATYPCDGAVTINLGAGCPLPLGGEASGTIEVTGRWTTVDQASLSQTFVNARVSAADKPLALASVTQVSAQRSGDTIAVKYVGAQAVAGGSFSATAVGGSATWDVTVDTKSTPDPADDRLTIKVTSANASSGILSSARVIKVEGAVLDPSCRQNPIAGTADITEVSGLIPKIIKIQFHSACDGMAEVNGNSTELQLLP